MKSLELRIPPVAVVLVIAAGMWLLALALPGLAFALPLRRTLAVALVAAGVLVALAGIIAFRRARTTVNPMTPGAATTLVASGIYRRSRNPMYLGLLLLLTGWGVFLANGAAMLLLPLFVAFMNRFQIVPEERALAASFGDGYQQYRQSVRRWI